MKLKGNLLDKPAAPVYSKEKIPYFSEKHNVDSFPVEKAGHPSPHDIEDNKMVSEGSMYPVQYYDEKKK
ncbi:hypothetical protein DT075_35985 [Bacillus licheniformis]|nr:hypothetical protein DT075_35985 [Bacillus licheniformis]